MKVIITIEIPDGADVQVTPVEPPMAPGQDPRVLADLARPLAEVTEDLQAAVAKRDEERVGELAVAAYLAGSSWPKIAKAGSNNRPPSGWYWDLARRWAEPRGLPWPLPKRS
jgi:hypothetical protein